MVLSADAVKTILEKCRNSAVFTESACPLKVYRQRRLKYFGKNTIKIKIIFLKKRNF